MVRAGVNNNNNEEKQHNNNNRRDVLWHRSVSLNYTSSKTMPPSQRQRPHVVLTPTSDDESPTTSPRSPPAQLTSSAPAPRARDKRALPAPTLTLLPSPTAEPDNQRIANTLAGARRNPRFAITALGDALRQLEAAKRHLVTYRKHREGLECQVARLEKENVGLRARVGRLDAIERIVGASCCALRVGVLTA